MVCFMSVELCSNIFPFPHILKSSVQCFWRVLHWNLLFTSWGWVCVIFLNNAETQAACSTALKFISYFLFHVMSFASLVGSIVHLPMKGRTVSDFTQTIVNYPHRGEYCVKSTQIKAWISISKSVWMLVGVHNVHLCCLPVSTHFVSFTDLLFVTNVTNLQTLSM